MILKELGNYRYLVSSHSDPKKEYIVTFRKTNNGILDNDIKCTCPSNISFAKNQWCKHIKEVIKFLN